MFACVSKREMSEKLSKWAGESGAWRSIHPPLQQRRQIKHLRAVGGDHPTQVCD
jgi:hypothetical protein